MKYFSPFHFVALVTFLGFSSCAQGSDFIYLVAPFDTLSLIAIKTGTPYTPIYGQNGRLEKLLKLNPQIKNPDLITPGQYIYISERPHGDTRILSSEETNNIPPETLPPKEEPVITTEQTISLEEKKADLFFTVGLDLVYSKLDATDARTGSSAVFVSTLMPQVTLGLTQILDENVNLKTFVTYRNNSYDSPSSGQSLDSKKSTYNLIGLFEKDFNENWSANFNFGLKQKLFTRASSFTAYTLDVATVPTLGLGVNHIFYSQNNKNAGFDLNYSYLNTSKTTSQNIKSGMQQQLGLYLENKRKTFSLEQRVFYQNGQQNSSLVKQKETEVGFYLGLTYGF